LQDILEDESVLKLGVGPEEDCKLLFTDRGIVVSILSIVYSNLLDCLDLSFNKLESDTS